MRGALQHPRGFLQALVITLPVRALMSIPIVFLHKGAGVVFNDVPVNYTNLATLQARLFNPQARIVVIGDEPCRGSLLGFESETAALEEFEEVIQPVRALYRHCSPNNPEIEFLCVARWFVLREWMHRNNVPRCLHLDTDVLFYESASTLDRQFANSDMILSLGASGGNSIVSLRALDIVCRLVMEYYTDPDSQPALAAILRAREAGNLQAQITDMSFLAEALAQHPEVFTTISAETTAPSIDSNINLAEGFEMESGRKKIQFRDDLPHGFRENGGTPTRFAILHFQGNAKAFMADHLTCPNDQRALGRPMLECMRQYRQDMQQANIRIRSLHGENTKYRSEMNKLHDASQTLHKTLRKIRQSTWVKAGEALKISSSRKSLAECETLSGAIKNLARRKHDGG